MSSSEGVEVCDGENLAIILGLYWVVYMIINAIIFAAAMYGLQQYLEKANGPKGSKNSERREKDRHNESRASSTISSEAGLISRSKQ